ncbi:MAG: TPM domain-containing protein [Pseudomonadota bacterium]
MKTNTIRIVQFLIIVVIFFNFVLLSGSNRLQESTNNKIDENVIYDKAELLTQKESAYLNALLNKHNMKGPGNISVIIITELPGEITIERYANEFMEGLKIAGIGKSDNILLLIAVKNRKIRIETSKSISDILIDDYCHKIIEDLIVPKFKQNQYYQGIKTGLLEMISKLEAEGTNWDNPLKGRQNSGQTSNSD